MGALNTIAVALSCAEGDAALIAYASLLARLGGAREVRFAHVLKEAEASAAELRESMRRGVEAQFRASSRTECDVLRGPLTDRLLDYVSELQADLVLIGARRRVLGARLAMVAPCSVAVIPEDAPPEMKHILVAIDFSEAAGDSLEWVTSLAAAGRDIRCTALHVMTHESADLFADQESEPEQAQAMRRILARTDRNGVAVTPRLAEVGASGDIGRRKRFFLPASIEGADVAHVILAEAARCGADCIALSTRGRSASASILLGSVTEKVIDRAKIPLLVRKHAAANLGLAQILLGRASRRAAVKTN
jgi:nucleotide-binding universal stress UspA family protein